ncbi:hypothetical protein CSUI_006699 [Cystoisospora suis]|uniref:Uncharacterized protein n=1 Tax=Cystoisospora suis TaxID=483139 RepID=A0A2C6KT53_9APIC|nr:hypothetical protein CSUI_006699 [Cystoisospora suis]
MMVAVIVKGVIPLRFSLFFFIFLFYSCWYRGEREREKTPIYVGAADEFQDLLAGHELQELLRRDWDPPLPTIPAKTLIVQEKDMTEWRKYHQELHPEEEYLVLLVNTTAIRMMPRFYMQEAYDVDDSVCDLISLKHYTQMFLPLPPGRLVWSILDHRSLNPSKFSLPPPSSDSSEEDEKTKKNTETSPPKQDGSIPGGEAPAASSPADKNRQETIERKVDSSIASSSSSPSKKDVSDGSPSIHPYFGRLRISAIQERREEESLLWRREILADDDTFLTVKSLLLKVPPEEYLKSEETEFCIIARRKNCSKQGVSLLVTITKTSNTHDRFSLSRYFTILPGTTATASVLLAFVLS